MKELNCWHSLLALMAVCVIVTTGMPTNVNADDSIKAIVRPGSPHRWQKAFEHW